MTKDSKDIVRKQHSTIVLWMVVFMAVATVGLTITKLISTEYNYALGLLMGYAGNYIYQNYRTAPSV